QILQHLHIIRIHHFFCKFHLCHFFFTADSHFHCTAAGRGSVFFLLQSLLALLHLLLHFLCLFHQIVHISGHSHSSGKSSTSCHNSFPPIVSFILPNPFPGPLLSPHPY